LSVQVSIENVSPVEVSVSEESVPVTVDSADTQSITISAKEDFELTTSVTQGLSFLIPNPESSISVEQTSSIALEVDGKRGVLSNDIGIRKYDATEDVPRTGDPFLFFVADDDGNGAAIGFWDGTDIQIVISVTI
jgi:hypothetical protein